MNHTGTWSTVRPRQARMNGESSNGLARCCAHSVATAAPQRAVARVGATGGRNCDAAARRRFGPPERLLRIATMARV